MDPELHCLPNGWVETSVEQIINKIPIRNKIKQKMYQKSGKLPIIDQGQNFIGGFTDDVDFKINCNLPVIIFGDHTKTIKFVNQEFAPGADGIKIMKPKPPLNVKLIYHFIRALSLPNKGYARHYQYLLKSMIRIPPHNEQRRIVQKLESIFAQIDAARGRLLELQGRTRYGKESMADLKSSVLKQAFEGKLVPQDPSDEPAEELLKRTYGDSKNLVLETANLPKGWVLFQFGIIKPSSERFDPTREKSRKYVGLEHMEKNTGRIIGTTDSKIATSSKTVFHKGDLLYGKLRPYLNKVAIPDFDGVCSSDILVFAEQPFITNTFLKYLLMTTNFVKFANSTMSGVQHPRTSHKKLSTYQIPLPPLPEQHRIVSKLESIFAKIDAIRQLTNLKMTKFFVKFVF